MRPQRSRNNWSEKRALANENLRIRNALDKCSTNVMIANADGNIIYERNSHGHDPARNENELRRALPSSTRTKLITVYH